MPIVQVGLLQTQCNGANTLAMDWHSGSDTIVIIPCFNEAARLDLRSFAEYLAASPNISFQFVDDGSTDATGTMLDKFAARHLGRAGVLHLPRNCGKGEAVRQGMLSAIQRRPEFVGYWDADLATPLDAIGQFRDLLRDRADLVLVMGSRVALLGRHINRKLVRHLLGRGFATAASLTLGLVVYDTQCGAKLFRTTPEAAGVFDKPFRSRWVFDVEILARILAADPDNAEESIYEFPLDRWTDVQGSQLKPSDFVRAATDLASIYWRAVRGRSKSPTSRPIALRPDRREAA
jgi:dolichyl-phosphate beta-glucosyltransferase